MLSLSNLNNRIGMPAGIQKNKRGRYDDNILHRIRSLLPNNSLKTESEIKNLDHLLYMIYKLDVSKKRRPNIDLVKITTAFEKFVMENGHLNKTVSNLSYEDLLMLKRFLSRCVKSDSVLDRFTQVDKSKLKEIHQQIRTLYYSRYSGMHMVRNLEKKQRIKSLGFTAENLRIFGDENVDANTVSAMKKAFQNGDDLTNINWLHGTNSSTIAAMAVTDKKLKPAGKIRKDGNLAFYGENGKGSFGVNEEMISGVDFLNYGGAVTYATGGIGYNDHMSFSCTRDPKKSIDFYEKWIEENTDKDNIWQSYTSIIFATEVPIKLYNFHRHMKILATLEPELFQSKIIPKIQDVIAKLSKNTDSEFNYYLHGKRIKPSQELVEIVFKPVLDFPKMTNAYDMKDKELTQKAIPVVFGTTKVTNGHRIVSSISGETGYKGTLELGSELPYVFVPTNEMTTIENYLKQKNISDVEVYNLATLVLASKIEAFRSKKTLLSVI